MLPLLVGRAEIVETLQSEGELGVQSIRTLEEGWGLILGGLPQEGILKKSFTVRVR